jgi:hypothetical protein
MAKVISKLTHSNLVEIGAKYLFGKRYMVVLKELATCIPETPDVLGFRSGWSYLLEAKVSRGDFKGDAKKSFRHYPEKGVGNYRSYVCPKGLIKPEELPAGWGLVYVDPITKRLRTIVFPRYQSSNLHNEQLLLVSVVRRMIDGFEYKKYLHRVPEGDTNNGIR